VRLGDYIIETKNIDEDFNVYYKLTGEITITKKARSEISTKKYLFFGPEVRKEVTAWTCKINANGDKTQLYEPRALAKLVVKALENQKIIVNPYKAEDLLTEALKPYVNRALDLCVYTKRTHTLYNHESDCKLLTPEQQEEYRTTRKVPN
jgi:hypothetical protein